MNISILGSGTMGGTLGKLWAKAGHRVLFSSRHPENLTTLVQEAGNQASAGTVEQAVDFAEVCLLAVGFSAMPEVVSRCAGLRNKIVIDITNPVSWDEATQRLIPLLPANTTAASKLLEL